VDSLLSQAKSLYVVLTRINLRVVQLCERRTPRYNRRMDLRTEAWVKATLANNETDSDSAIRAQFIAAGLSEGEADEWLAQRSLYLRHLVVDGMEGQSPGAVRA
jgi:hypothetical protein